PRLLTTRPNDPMPHPLPIPVVGDLDGNGTPEIAVMYDVVERPADKTGGLQRYLEVVALKGRNGQPKWKPWRARDHRLSLFPALPRPILVNLDGDGRRAIALTIDAGKQYELVLLDSYGSLRERKQIQRAGFGPPTLWSYDLTGDGKEELLFVDQSSYSEKVRATQG